MRRRWDPSRWRRWPGRPRWWRLLIGVVATPLIVASLIAGFFALDPPFWPSAEVQVYVANSRSANTTHDRSIYLVKHAFHTSISLRAADLDPTGWPDPEAYARTWVDISWGDAVYFRRGSDACDDAGRSAAAWPCGDAYRIV